MSNSFLNFCIQFILKLSNEFKGYIVTIYIFFFHSACCKTDLGNEFFALCIWGCLNCSFLFDKFCLVYALYLSAFWICHLNTPLTLMRNQLLIDWRLLAYKQWVACSWHSIPSLVWVLPWCEYHWIYSICSQSTSCICNLILLIKFEKWSAIISPNIVSSPFPLSGNFVVIMLVYCCCDLVLLSSALLFFFLYSSHKTNTIDLFSNSSLLFYCQLKSVIHVSFQILSFK